MTCLLRETDFSHHQILLCSLFFPSFPFSCLVVFFFFLIFVPSFPRRRRFVLEKGSFVFDFQCASFFLFYGQTFSSPEKETILSFSELPPSFFMGNFLFAEAACDPFLPSRRAPFPFVPLLDAPSRNFLLRLLSSWLFFSLGLSVFLSPLPRYLEMLVCPPSDLSFFTSNGSHKSRYHSVCPRSVPPLPLVPPIHLLSVSTSPLRFLFRSPVPLTHPFPFDPAAATLKSYRLLPASAATFLS